MFKDSPPQQFTGGVEVLCTDRVWLVFLDHQNSVEVCRSSSSSVSRKRGEETSGPADQKHHFDGKEEAQNSTKTNTRQDGGDRRKKKCSGAFKRAKQLPGTLYTVIIR